MEAARAHELAGLLVADERIVVPAIPQEPAGFDELLGHRIAFGVRWMLAPEHGTRLGIGSRDDIPAGASAGDMVERREAACHVIGLGVGGRRGGGEADLARAHGERRQQGQRLELADGRGVLAVAGGKAVAQEEHVELAALGRGRDVLHQAEIGPSFDCGIGMPPAADVMAGRLHEDAEAHLAARLWFEILFHSWSFLSAGECFIFSAIKSKQGAAPGRGHDFHNSHRSGGLFGNGWCLGMAGGNPQHSDAAREVRLSGRHEPR